MLMKEKTVQILPYILSFYIAFVFTQSLYFKFTGSSETEYIFQTLDQWFYQLTGFENVFLVPGIFNAYVIGIAELIASLLLLAGLFTPYKVLNPFGALMSLSVISGAIFFHLFTPLGIEVKGDGCTLFFMAVGIWFSSIALLVLGAGYITSSR